MTLAPNTLAPLPAQLLFAQLNPKKFYDNLFVNAPVIATEAESLDLSEYKHIYVLGVGKTAPHEVVALLDQLEACTLKPAARGLRHFQWSL